MDQMFTSRRNRMSTVWRMVAFDDAVSCPTVYWLAEHVAGLGRKFLSSFLKSTARWHRETQLLGEEVVAMRLKPGTNQGFASIDILRRPGVCGLSHACCPKRPEKGKHENPQEVIMQDIPANSNRSARDTVDDCLPGSETPQRWSSGVDPKGLAHLTC